MSVTYDPHMPRTLRVHDIFGAYCSEHGYGHRVMCPGCSGSNPATAGQQTGAVMSTEKRTGRGHGSSYDPHMPRTIKVDPTWGAYCSEHGYGHRVMCPGCSGRNVAPAREVTVS